MGFAKEDPMTKNTDPITNFVARLRKLDSKLGREAKKLIPYWWDNSLKDQEGACQSVIVSLSELFNLDLATVFDDASDLRFKEVSCCFKKADDKSIEELLPATSIVNSVSRTVLEMVENEYETFSDSEQIRKEILSNKAPWVGLISLVNYCWNKGVPVLFLPELPTTKKMDAVVQDIDGRPVITITKKHKHESALLFLLAHEMGHIFHNHLENGQAIIDNKIDESESIDKQEMEANAFALSLLTGCSDTAYHSSGRRLSGKQLAIAAKQKGIKENIDPGHIALNWAFTTNHWSIGTNALNILYPTLSWQTDLKNIFISNIDQLEANDDQLEFLFNLMNIEVGIAIS